MSLTVSQNEGVFVITITSNPKSKWPIWRQILKNLCETDMPAKPQDVARKIISLLVVLGIVQIVVGILNIITGILFLSWKIHDHIMMWNSPFWLGAMFLVSGIMTIMLPYCPRYATFAIAIILNELSGVMAMIAAGLYSWDLMSSHQAKHFLPQTGQAHYTTGRRSIDAVMIVLAVVQLCINVAFIVVSLSACLGKNAADDSPDYKPLPKKTTDNSAC